MPRPRVKDDERKRVAKACDTCKRRKEKCDGGEPCLLCKRRNREGECTYTLPRRRRAGNTQRDSITTESPSLQLGEALASSNDADAIESLLTLSGSRSAPKTPAFETTFDPVNGHAPVPKLARLLRDGHGKFIFVGDSSNLAFLQNIRRLVRTAIGESNLTTDPLRHAMIEAIPGGQGPATPKFDVVKPSKSEAQDLLHYYLLVSSGVIDLFDKNDIIQHLTAWTETPSSGNNAADSIFYLVLALGAKGRPSTGDDVPEAYFTKGRELAASSFMDDPSVLTVQSYVLISFYLLTSCRRNGAFMLLGIAIRAAYALGLHRSDISALFEAKERRIREKVWKSLRVLDLFMSASLGRPPATSEVDGGNVAWESKARGYEDIRMGALHSSAMLRICFIFERILNEVYCRREVDVQLVNSISAQYRDWNLALENGLDIDGLTDGESPSSMELQKIIGLAHLKGAYYWSIILLTRPFLIFEVSSKFPGEEQLAVQSPKTSADTTTLSEACVDAALRSIEVASDVVHTPGCPRRPVLITNSVFVSGLVIGLAMLGDYDKSFPLSSSLDQAKRVLGLLAKHDPSARRFFTITTYLQQAALEHVKRRDANQLEKRRQDIHSIFGDLLHRETSNQDKPPVTNGHLESSNVSSPGVNQDLSWTQRLEDTSNKRGPILTTSGVLASSTREPSAMPNDIIPAFEGNDFFGNPGAFSGGDTMDLPAYAEEFPLFSLLDDFPDGEAFLDFV